MVRKCSHKIDKYMSDKNINPQVIPGQAPDSSLIEQKPSLSFPKKIASIILLAILAIGIPISFFLFLNPTELKKPSVSIPTITPKATDMPSPTQVAGELIASIKLGQTIIIPDTAISLTYKSADIPGDNCNDCISSNVIEAKMNGQIKTLNYSCGGFSGECITKREIFGYQLEILEQISKDSLKLKIKKQ